MFYGFMQNILEEISLLLKKYTHCNYIALTSRGNTAILTALRLIKKVSSKKCILIPDQGAWITYPKYPPKLGFEVEYVKTDSAMIDVNDLKKKLHKAAAFLYENPGAYIIEQPLEDIYKVCKDQCLVILDVSGSISTKGCNGNYADILVGSFGQWKPVNLHYGGFIAFREKKYFDLLDIPLKDRFDEKYYGPLLEKLQNVGRRLEFLARVRKKVLNDLSDMDIIYPKSQGLNVIVRFHTEEQKSKLIGYCHQNKLEYTECPRYIRVMEKAISIEIKRLE